MNSLHLYIMSKHKYLEKNYFLSPANLFLYLGLFVLTLGCMGTSDKYGPMYIGGKIINPKAEYVYFAKDLKFIDSAKIDTDNKFSFQLDSMELGLFSFHHGDELQFIYLEPNDSLLIHLNTWDFDESLIFSGTQASKNNYLVNSWLEQERFEENFYSNYQLNESEFSEVIEAEIEKKLELYNHLIELEGEEPSEFFKELAEVGIYYPLYTLKEYYPIKNKKEMKLDSLPKLSDNFYSYRNSIDLNNEALNGYYPYRSFVLSYLGIKAYKEYLNDPKNINSTLNYMKIVTEEITSESYKNELLAKKLWRCLTDNHISDDDFKEVQEYFFENCSSEEICEEIKKSVAQKAQLKEGEKLPEINAYNSDGEKVIINDVSQNTNTVIYFWPKDLGRVQKLDDKLTSLQKKYPDILFIGIERDKSNEVWIKFIESKKLPKENQFILSKDSDTYAYFEGDMDRTVIINRDGNIHNGYLFFSDQNLEYQLKKINIE